jgi:aminoglycoside phosphotransferase (APT) family kinase protein
MDEVAITTQRLGALTRCQIQGALDRFRLGRLVNAQPTGEGLFGQNVFITAESGDWVLRGAPHFEWQFPTERYFARFLHERTVAPVPWPYHFDQLEDIFGWSYVLMPRMPGRSFSESDWFKTLDITERVAIAAALGKTLADIHAAIAPIAGSYDPVSENVTPFPNGYGEWVIERIETLLTEALTYTPYTTPADAAAVRAFVAAGRDALSEPYQPCVVMEDYQLGNVTIAGDIGRWRVGGV